MKFVGLGEGGDVGGMLSYIISAFEECGESGPYGVGGVVLSELLNYCYERGISYSLVYVSGCGYYVKRGVVGGVVPDEVLTSWVE